MPFLKLNNNWSNLSQYYNQSFNNKPKIPAIRYVGFDDGLIRGGVINTALASAQDTLRIGKFFASGKGTLFIIKQVGLQLSNPLLEQETPKSSLSTSGNGLIQNIANTVTNFINKRSPNQIYNLGLNTLAQIPINALGGHIIRHGKLPVGGVGFLGNSSLNNINGYNYEKITATNAGLLTDNASDRTSIALKNNRLLTYLSYYQGNPPSKGPNAVTYSPDDTIPLLLQEYNGGASSVYGIGKTRIFSTAIRTDFKTTENNQNFEGLTYQGLKTWFDTYRSEAETGTINFENTTNNLYIQASKTRVEALGVLNRPKNPIQKTSGLQNYRDFTRLTDRAKQLEDQADLLAKQKEENFGNNRDADFNVYQGLDNSGDLIKSYKTKNIQSRLGVSTSKFGPNNIKQNYKVDSINAISITDKVTFENNIKQKKISSDILTEYKNKVDGYYGKDIVRFTIEFINNDSTIYDTDVLAFRAYINDFNDGMNARWNAYRYVGRGEDFYVYDGFTRDISIDFTMFAHTPEEMKPLYEKLNYLMSTFSPDYNKAWKMRGNIAVLTVGDYLYQQPGIFTDIKLSGMLDTGWEANIDDNEFDLANPKSYQAPKHIKVSLSFKPIHAVLPRKVNRNNPFLSNFVLRSKQIPLPPPDPKDPVKSVEEKATDNSVIPKQDPGGVIPEILQENKNIKKKGEK